MPWCGWHLLRRAQNVRGRDRSGQEKKQAWPGLVLERFGHSPACCRWRQPVSSHQEPHETLEHCPRLRHASAACDLHGCSPPAHVWPEINSERRRRESLGQALTFAPLSKMATLPSTLSGTSDIRSKYPGLGIDPRKRARRPGPGEMVPIRVLRGKVRAWQRKRAIQPHLAADPTRQTQGSARNLSCVTTAERLFLREHSCWGRGG